MRDMKFRPLYTDEEKKMVDIIDSRKNTREAVQLCYRSAGLRDKEIFMPLGISPQYWSKIIRHEAPLEADLLLQIQDIAGNNIIAQWFASQSGGLFVPKPKTKEEEMQEVIERQAQEIKRLKELMKKTEAQFMHNEDEFDAPLPSSPLSMQG